MRYFFKCIKSRQNKNVINGLFLEDGNFTSEKGQIKKELVSFFKNLLTCQGEGSFDENFKGLLDFKIPRDIVFDMVKEVTSEEIKHTLFDMNSNKALGPMGLELSF